MVAERKSKRVIFTPCPPSPARRAIDPSENNRTDAWLNAWLTDLSVIYPELADDIPGYAKALHKLGYINERRLAFMHTGDPVSELKAALKINGVLAKALVDEGLGLHPREEDDAPTPVRSIRSRSNSRSRSPSKRKFGVFNDQLKGTNTCSASELKRFLESLLCFIYGQSDELGAILCQFCLDPGMGDVAFNMLQAKVSERLQRQLAAVIMPALPKQMGEAMSAQHQPGVYGMVLLRAVCAHHYGPHAIKAKLLAAANLCYNEVVPVTQKCDLREHLDAHLRGLQFLEDAGQALGDAMKMVGLHKLVSELKLLPEIEAARNIHERTSSVWECKDLLVLLDKRANEWLLLDPSPAQHVAAAAGHIANCHLWMKGDCPTPDCIFKHDPMYKGRSDLIPNCSVLKQKGFCDRPACTFNHPKQSAKAARQLATKLAQQAALVANGSPVPAPIVPAPNPVPNSEISELKAMIASLVQQGAQQTALIAAILADDDD